MVYANSHLIPEDTSSEYSREGTAAHDFAADVLLNKITIDDVPEEVFRDPIKDYVDHCLALVPEGISYQVEVVAPLWYSPGSSGTSDFAVVTDDLVIVRDLKFGQGVLVHGHLNTQLAIYGYSLIRMMEDIYGFNDDTVVNLGVFQPRHREAQDAQPWVLTLGELEKFCKEIEYKAAQCNAGLERVMAKLPCGERDISCAEIIEAAPGLAFVPQEGDDGSCRWCKIKSRCGARLAAATEGMDLPDISGVDLIALLPDLSKEQSKLPVEERIEEVALEVCSEEDLTTMPAEIVSDEYLVKIYERSKAIRRFLDDIEEHLESRALAGNPVPGTKLCLGRAGNRAWANEEAADTFIRGQGLKEKERYKFTLLSPTQIEAALDIKNKPKRTQSRFAELVTRSPAKPVLALASDKREAISAPVDMLPDITEDV
jgi:hypothetical protein